MVGRDEYAKKGRNECVTKEAELQLIQTASTPEYARRVDLVLSGK
jgi:hypothetical protein